MKKYKTLLFKIQKQLTSVLFPTALLSSLPFFSPCKASLASSKVTNCDERNLFEIMLFFTLGISVSPEELLLSLDVDEELLSDPLHAAVHRGGVNLVEEEAHEPGAQECHPPHYHHHSHLGYIKVNCSID